MGKLDHNYYYPHGTRLDRRGYVLKPPYLRPLRYGESDAVGDTMRLTVTVVCGRLLMKPKILEKMGMVTAKLLKTAGRIAFNKVR